MSLWVPAHGARISLNLSPTPSSAPSAFQHVTRPEPEGIMTDPGLQKRKKNEVSRRSSPLAQRRFRGKLLTPTCVQPHSSGRGVSSEQAPGIHRAPGTSEGAANAGLTGTTGWGDGPRVRVRLPAGKAPSPPSPWLCPGRD